MAEAYPWQDGLWQQMAGRAHHAHAYLLHGPAGIGKRALAERLMARLKMAELPRNANPTRVRNRCELTGRSRAYYRKFKLSRVMLRELGNKGLIPGLTKSSW